MTSSRMSSRIASPIPVTVEQLLDARERPVLRPVVDDRLRDHLADARERLELRRARRVDVDEPAPARRPRAAAARRPAAGAGCTRSDHEDLRAVRERRGEVQRARAAAPGRAPPAASIASTVRAPSGN